MYREFVSWVEATEMLAPPNAPRTHPSMPPRDEEALRQALRTGRIFPLVELEHPAQGIFNGSNEPKGGKTRLSMWEEHILLNDFMEDRKNIYFELDGWFFLNEEGAKSMARSVGISGDWPVIPADDGGRALPNIQFEVGFRDLQRDNLWFRTLDVEGLRNPQSMVGLDSAEKEKPLDERERTTLLCIIGALARQAKLDLSQPIKAGDTVAAMAPELKLSGRTIGEKLKLVGEAMDRRTE